jgi:SNF2 family DNA or RNA helicase
MDLFKNRRGVALLCDMGTGKTIIAIAIAGALYECGKIAKMLVVCPKSIVGVWEAEFMRFADYEYRLAVLDGSVTKKADTIRHTGGDGLQVIVVNYESAWRLEAELSKWKPDLIVCDESSKIKNPQAKQAKALHNLGRVAPFKAILTGTPITNSPLDFFSQYKFMDEGVFGASFYAFRARYAIIGGYGNHQIVGYKNMPELVEKAHSIAFRIRIEDAVELPRQNRRGAGNRARTQRECNLQRH